MNARLILYVILSIVMAVSWASSCVIYRAAEIGELVGPMDDQYFGNLKAVVVGSGNGFENPERMGPSIAIGWDERLVLVDAGRGVAESMRAARLPLAQAEAVLLTSLLPENTVGLDDLFLTGWRQPRTKPLRVYGPPGTEAFCEALVTAHAIGIAAEGAGRGLPPEGGVLIGHDINPGWTADLDGLEITTADLPGGPTPALAWRFDRDGRSIVVVGAGWAPEAVVEFAAGANFMFHEGVIIPPAEDAVEAGIMIDPELLRLEAKLHTPLIDVGSIAARANVDNVVLVRLRPPPFYNFQVTGSVQQSYNGGIHIASDGDEIEPPRRSD